jgi:hypothetical protein
MTSVVPEFMVVIPVDVDVEVSPPVVEVPSVDVPPVEVPSVEVPSVDVPVLPESLSLAEVDAFEVDEPEALAVAVAVAEVVDGFVDTPSLSSSPPAQPTASDARNNGALRITVRTKDMVNSTPAGRVHIRTIRGQRRGAVAQNGRSAMSQSRTPTGPYAVTEAASRRPGRPRASPPHDDPPWHPARSRS